MASALSYAASDGWLAFEAPAKINLYLGVYTEKDERGYHRVDSVMTAVDISDKVFVRPAKDLSVSCDPSAHVPQEKNTCWKAAQAFASMFSYDASVEIHIEKHIPSQAGLGGASADAAAVLCALCELSGIDTADVRVSEVARQVGADVPFFLFGKPCYFAGAGDVLAEEFAALDALPVALVRPPGHGVSTPAAYADFDRCPVEAGSLDEMLSALRAGDTDKMVCAVTNNLGPVACRLHEGCAQVLKWLSNQDHALVAQVSGSGSCVFALCDSSDNATRIAQAAQIHGWWSCATKVRDHGICRI